jgi:thymidylate synthase
MNEGHILNFNGQSVISGSWDRVYANYLRALMEQGEVFEGRNGETRAAFGCSIRADLREGFPLTRLRKLPWKNICREFLFDIGFNTNVEALGPAKHFWDFLADESGELGASAYCRQWRQWPASAPGAEFPNETLVTDRSVDQLNDVIVKLIEAPNSRQATVITHNPTAVNPACPPCHIGMQFMPAKDGWLDLMVPARSNDMVVGFPLDIARYAIMLKVVALRTEKTARFVYMPSANSHIYENCYDLVAQMLQRSWKDECQMTLSRDWAAKGTLKTLTEDDFVLQDYDPHPAIKVSVN